MRVMPKCCPFPHAAARILVKSGRIIVCLGKCRTKEHTHLKLNRSWLIHTNRIVGGDLHGSGP